jgi:hypothetical protein
MNPSFEAFGDELIKIAFFKRLQKGFTDALSEGWHGIGPEDSITRNTWMGKGRQIKPAIDPTTGVRNQLSRSNRLWEEASSLGGLTRALPVGAKSMIAGTTGLMALQALRKQDPSGQERSRPERLTGLAANTVGGLAGSAAAMRLLGSRGGALGAIAAPMVGGMLGGHLAEQTVTTPFRAARAARPALYTPAPQMPQGYGPEGVPA